MFIRKSVFSKLILVVLVTLLLNITGCGSKASSAGSTSTTQSTAQTAKSASTKATNVTYENYLKISLGMTYDDVKAFLGEGKKKDVKTDVVDYTWKDQAKSILIKTEKGKVVLKSQTKLGKTVSKLTVDQVVKILGSDYAEVNYRTSNNSILRNVVWMLPDTAQHVTVYLKDGKVTKRTSTLKN